MSVLLELKERLKTIYGKYSSILKPCGKFLMAFCIFFTINTKIGYFASLKNPLAMVGMSLISAFLPGSVTVMLAVLLSIGHVYAVSYVLAIILTLLYVILFCLFFRYVPKQSYAVLAFPILYTFHIPYVIPVILGLFASPISMVSIVLGVVMTNLFDLIGEVAQVITNVDASDTVNTYNLIIDNLFARRHMMVSVLVFILVYLVTYGIRKASIAHSSLFAILSAGVVNMIGFLVANLLTEGEKVAGNWSVIGGTLASVAIALVAYFFRMTLDYSGVKNVQFEDDEYYYYVKAVPKIMVSTSEKKVKRIHAQKSNSNTLNLQDEIQKAYSQSVEYRESYKEEVETDDNLGGDDGSD